MPAAHTSLYFDYGLTSDYGSTVTYGSIGSATTAASYSYTMAGTFLCGRTYHYRARALNSGGTGTGSDVAFTTGACPSTITVSPRSLKFGAIKNGSGGAITRVTAAQTVSVSFSSGSPEWTASVDQPWVQLSKTGDKGAASFLVSIVNPGNVLGASTNVTATVRLAAAGATNSPQDVSITLSIDQSTGTPTTKPIGQVDTPAQHSTASGAIGVTGWVLDNIGVTSVKIYRNCLTFENQSNCQVVLGSSVVFVGDAVFLAGVRTDVEGAFSSYPENHRAGWGFLLLTSMLPHVTNRLSYGGQGPLVLSVVATDVEGNQKLLGRSSDPASADFTTPTNITMTNDSIAKPFGAIDTPAQGATVSGVVHNFGWALTPDSDTTSGAADILIPTNGTTMTVYIDGVPTAPVAYNQCRGSVGNPVPLGLFCNDDVSNIFGNLTPQAVLTTRTGNPTRFRNLDVARSAIGAYSFNTTTLSNGLHTIAWSVTDSAGRTEGIGSRFFYVLNSGADQPQQRGVERVHLSAEATDPARIVGEASSLSALTRTTAGVQGRAGYAVDSVWTPMRGSVDGSFRVRLPALDRLELRLGSSVDAGYLMANGTLRPLPIGSTLDGDLFAWAPPAGYFGTYDLVFVRGSERVDVAVTVAPPAPIDETVAQVRMSLDGATPSGLSASGQLSVRLDGWAYDPHSVVGPGIGAVHVWARRLDSPGPSVFVGAADLNVTRPDVERAFEDAPAGAGYSLTTSLAPGTYEVTAYVWSTRMGRFEDARSIVTVLR